MGEYEEVAEGVFQVGGSDYSDPSDAAVYVIACKADLVMIDCGAGRGSQAIVENIQEAGLDPAKITTLVLTHCHVDHIGAVEFFSRNYGCTVVAHEKDADAIESGDPSLTAARWYNTRLPATIVHRRLKAEHETVSCGTVELHCIHTPGHTPGSIAVYMDGPSGRILFGQDIHGPFSREFRSDIGLWRSSMHRLLDLGADILCEGHFGIFRPRERVQRYIQGYLDQYAGE